MHQVETPLFSKILFPIQFDRITIPALEMVTHLARQADRFVYLLCVIPEDTPDIRRVANKVFVTSNRTSAEIDTEAPAADEKKVGGAQ